MATKVNGAGNYGAQLQVTDEFVIMAFPKCGKPVKEVKLEPDGDTGFYKVPKNYLYGQGSATLANGSTVRGTWTLPIDRALREKMREAGIAKGLKVRELEPEKKGKPAAGPSEFSLEALLGKTFQAGDL